MFSTILVPLDGSELAEQALTHAMDLATRYGADLVLLRATALPDEMYTPRDFGHAYLQEYREAEEASIREYLEGWKARVEEKGILCRTAYRLEKASAAIAAEAASSGADLIVMSSHGRGGFERWVHGSVAEKVLRRSPCPLLLVRVQGPVEEGEEPE